MPCSASGRHAPAQASASAAPSGWVLIAAGQRERGCPDSRTAVPRGPAGAAARRAANSSPPGSACARPTPTSGRAAMTSVWIGYSTSRGPLPSSTEPSGPTRMTLPGVGLLGPQPALFIQAPRPPGSRTLACPLAMSACPAAASAREASTASRTAPCRVRGLVAHVSLIPGSRDGLTLGSWEAKMDILVVGGGIGGLDRRLGPGSRRAPGPGARESRAVRRTRARPAARAQRDQGAGPAGRARPRARSRRTAAAAAAARAVTAAQLTALDLGEPFTARYQAPYVVMHRSDLLAILYDACQPRRRALPGPRRLRGHRRRRRRHRRVRRRHQLPGGGRDRGRRPALRHAASSSPPTSPSARASPPTAARPGSTR